MSHEQLIRRLWDASAEHGTHDGSPPDRSVLLAEAAEALGTLVDELDVLRELLRSRTSADSR
jgi:hypothetical protein